MYDINIKNVEKGRSFFAIFLVLGLIFLGVLMTIFFFTQKNKQSFNSAVFSSSVEVKSHIDSEGRELYTPVYYYEVKGKQYSCKSNSSSTIYPKTNKKTVYYDSNNPSHCMTEYSKNKKHIILILCILPIIFIIVGIYNIIKVNKRVNVIKKLNQTGKLIKHLPYRMEDTGITIKNVQIQRPVIDYTLPSGSTLTLLGDPRYDQKYFGTDGMVDLLIDENNTDNYYIDFEINRLTGNLPSDYYQQPNQNNRGKCKK